MATLLRPIQFSLLAAAVLAVGCRGQISEKPPVHLNPNMDTQEKGKAYRKDATGLFADGRVMRTPPEGTVAQGELHDDDQATLGVDVDGGVLSKFPAAYPLNAEMRARGKDRYQIYCAPCHGIEADGKGTVADNKGLLVPPPSFHDPRLKEMQNGKIYAAMLNGVNNGNMPSYAAQIPEADRWAIVAGIRTLQQEKDSNVPDEPTGAAQVARSKTPTPEYGASLYKAKGCNACHSVDGTKIVGPTLKGLYGKSEALESGDVAVDDAYLKESMLQPMAKIVKGFPPAMPPQALDDFEVQSLILYIKSLK